jgi:diacylglycerol kinase
MRAHKVGDRRMVRHRSLLPRFQDAIRGVLLAYREEFNLRFHLFATACAFVMGYAVRLDGWEVAYLALTVSLVLLAELFNTAVERAVDFAAAGRRHPLAGQAKQVAAGAVLFAAAHAGFAALYVFVVHRSVLVTLGGLTALLHTAPWLYLLPLLAGVMGILGGRNDE